MRGAVTSGVRSVGGALRSAAQSGASAARNEVSNIAGGRLGGLLGRGCRTNSFTGSTAVLMADGSRKAIRDVRVGDLVLATDPTTGRTEKRAVTDVIVGQGDKRLVAVAVDVDGRAGGRTATVTATDEHPFWVESLKRWVNAKDLRPGHRLETADHRDATTVVATRQRTEHQRVYNLTVDGIHTYHVLAGNTSVLVHNCGPVANRKGPDLPVELMEADFMGAKPMFAGTDDFTGAMGGDGRYLWALDEDEALGIIPAAAGVKHTFITQGKPVLGAGQLQLSGGRVVSFDNMTGHYTPCEECAEGFLKRGSDAFLDAGFFIPRSKWINYGGLPH
ncbi:MAG TPA: polymorphic toxin-type HINT domain-containing protein [Micromonosporaceae bacterium]|nr:polymorphic toxin-type HINT domain-containing protein [Micromonosporaceae bacterium]